MQGAGAGEMDLPQTPRMTIALIDGDAWVYRCGFAAEKTKYLLEVWFDGAEHAALYPYDSHKEALARQKELGGTIWSRKEMEPLENCLQMVKSSLENTLQKTGTNDYRLYIGGKNNFREAIDADYKANRISAPKPKYYRDIREYMQSQWGANLVDGMEADDRVGIEATRLGSDAIIVAVDKDLQQIPGRHFNWVEGEFSTVSNKDGLSFFYHQLLTGDPSDNIRGLEGIGPVKAAKALADCKSPKDMALVVYEMYKAALGFDPSEVIERNATLLWIWRKEEDKHPFWRHYGRESI